MRGGTEMLERLGEPEERNLPFARNRRCLKQRCICDVHGEVTCFFYDGDEPHCPRCQENLRNAQLEREFRFSSHRIEVKRLLDDSGVDQSMQYMSVEGWESISKDDDAAKSKVSKWIPSNRKFLLMLGGIGAGKTWMAIGICNDLCRRKVSARYITLSMLSMLVKATYGRNAVKTTSGLFKEFMKYDVLVLDEFLPKRWDDFLESLVLERDLLGKRTVFVSNMDEEEVSETVGAHVMSRINGSGDVALFLDEDRRNMD